MTDAEALALLRLYGKVIEREDDIITLRKHDWNGYSYPGYHGYIHDIHDRVRRAMLVVVKNIEIGKNI